MTTLIKNVIIVDGFQKPPFKGDVLIRDKKIIAIGDLAQYKADNVIFGNEGYLSSGFIDPNASSDRYLTMFQSPLHKDFISQGITSIIIGQCGFSLAPSFYGTNLSHLSFWTRTNHINIDWKSVADFLNVIDKYKMGLNIGTLVGHKVIRENIVHNPKEFRNLTANEIRIFREVLSKALSQGAFGLSTGLGYFPYQNTTYHEIRALLDVLSKNKGVYATHLRNEREKLKESVQETLKISQETSVTTIISHFRPLIGFEDQYEESLTLIEEKTSKANVYFDINPFPASAVSLDSLVPEFMKENDPQLFIEKIQDKKIRKKVALELPKLDSKEVIILNAPGIEFINGKTLYEFANNRGLNEIEALFSLMESTKMRGVILYKNLNEEKIKKAILTQRSLISTNSPNFDDIFKNYKPERAYKTFPTYLKIASQNNISIENAIAKITSLPSTIFNIDKRGFIKEGYWADIVLMTKDLDIATVFVNGHIAFDNGNIVAKTGNGQVLKKFRK
jgi:N-acyl-D-amino-acid deacylase